MKNLDKAGVLELFPMPLGDAVLVRDFFSSAVLTELACVQVFLCEEVRVARRVFSALVDYLGPVQALDIRVLSQQTSMDVVGEYANVLSGCRVGIFSGAGVPVLADPGARLVAFAQRQGIDVVVHQVPCAPLMVLIGSGFSGQCFTFLGYLPIEAKARRRCVRAVAQQATARTQLFIETPYRNQALLASLIEWLPPSTQLCLGVNLGTGGQFIRTRTLAQWHSDLPVLHKQEATFAIGALLD